MQATQKNQVKRTKLFVGGFVLLHVLCCGLPLLIAAGALGATGSLLGNPWLVTAALLLAAGVLIWAIRRRSTGSSAKQDDCCSPTIQSQDSSKPQAERSVIER